MTAGRALHPYDERACVRLPVRLDTTICSSAVRKVRADLVDISVTGCRLASALYLAEGCHLTVTIPTLAPIGAKVRWCRDLGIGLQFRQPLHPSTIDRIVAMSDTHQAASHPMAARFDVETGPETGWRRQWRAGA